jgi:hypothetical protein
MKPVKIVWRILFVSPKGSKAYVQKHGKFFSFVTNKDSASTFLSLPEAEAFAETVKKVNQTPERISIEAGAP